MIRSSCQNHSVELSYLRGLGTEKNSHVTLKRAFEFRTTIMERFACANG